MKLREKQFNIIDNAGNPIDLSGEKVSVFINGVDSGLTIEDFFKEEIEFDDAEILGFSLLQYLEPKEGNLVDLEGNVISMKLNDIPIIFESIERPTLFKTSIEVPLEYIRTFSQLVGIKKPDELFTDLSATDKGTLISERQQKESELKKVQEKKETEEEEKKRLDLEAMAKVPEDYLIEMKEYIKTKRFHEKIGFKEYVVDSYHFFYGVDDTNDPFVLIKRGEDWFEQAEGEVTEETKEIAKYEFKDREETYIIILDVKQDAIKVTKQQG